MPAAPAEAGRGLLLLLGAAYRALRLSVILPALTQQTAHLEKDFAFLQQELRADNILHNLPKKARGQTGGQAGVRKETAQKYRQRKPSRFTKAPRLPEPGEL